MPSWKSIVRCVPVIIAMALAGAAGTAEAKGRQYAPPGNSAVGQYVETVPGVGGNRPSSSVTATPTGGGGGSTGGGSTVSPVVERRFDHHGKAGKSALALAEATRSPSPNSARGTLTVPTVSSSASQLLQTLGGSSGGGGLGVLLPVILIVSLVVISLLGLARRRRSV